MARLTQPPQTKAMASVRDVCRMVRLSPARFYGLLTLGVFPLPLYNISTRRPFYTEEQQLQCIEVRRRGLGVNGEPVLFYAARAHTAAPKPHPHRLPTPAPVPAPAPSPAPDAVVAGVRGLGLPRTTVAQVTAAMQEAFPGGTGNASTADVIKAVFLRLKCQATDHGEP